MPKLIHTFWRYTALEWKENELHKVGDSYSHKLLHGFGVLSCVWWEEEEVGKVGVAFNQSGKQKGTSSRFLIKHFTSFRI